MIKFIFITILIVFSAINSYSQDASKIAKELLSEYNKINTFQSDVSIKIDISYLNAPEKIGKIYFKSPNTTKVDIEGFSMLPKQGTGNFIGELLKLKSTVISLGKEKVNNIELTHLKLIPNESKDIVLVDMYVDENKMTVVKADITTKDNGTFYLDIEYVNSVKFNLPSKVEIEFVVPNFKMPKAFVGPRDKSKVDEMQKEGETTKGKVILKYWNYIVNQKIDNSIFKK